MASRAIICYEYLDKRMVVVGYTPRGDERHVFRYEESQ